MNRNACDRNAAVSIRPADYLTPAIDAGAVRLVSAERSGVFDAGAFRIARGVNEIGWPWYEGDVAGQITKRVDSSGACRHVLQAWHGRKTIRDRTRRVLFVRGTDQPG